MLDIWAAGIYALAPGLYRKLAGAGHRSFLDFKPPLGLVVEVPLVTATAPHFAWIVPKNP